MTTTFIKIVTFSTVKTLIKVSGIEFIASIDETVGIEDQEDEWEKGDSVHLIQIINQTVKH